MAVLLVAVLMVALLALVGIKQEKPEEQQRQQQRRRKQRGGWLRLRAMCEWVSRLPLCYQHSGTRQCVCTCHRLH